MGNGHRQSGRCDYNRYLKKCMCNCYDESGSEEPSKETVGSVGIQALAAFGGKVAKQAAKA
jgi:hypothetical protein